MPRSRSYQTKLIEALKDPVEAAEYLNAALEEGDREPFLLALRNVADAQGGIAKLSELTQLNRENLYRMLSEKGNPEFYSLNTLLDALGFRLGVEAKSSEPKLATAQQERNKILVFRTRRATAPSTGSRLALAAETKGRQTEKTMVITDDGQEFGSLEYDFERAELYLNLVRSLPDWCIINVEIQTKEGKQFQATTVPERGAKLILLRKVSSIKDKVEQIILTQGKGKAEG